MGSKKKKDALTYLQKLRKLKTSGLEHSPVINREANDLDALPTLEERVKTILEIIKKREIIANDMLFFVMYDIESNKVRYNIVKYLERMGCFRIQKSIFLANLSIEKYESIKNDLAEVQDSYDNHDSSIVCPISSDYLSSMRVIGQSINLDLITRSKNTLFF